MVWDVEEEVVLWCGAVALLPGGSVSVGEASLEERDEGFRGVAAFTEASIEFFQIGAAVVGARGKAVHTPNHAVDEAR
jgi:hypothetical protein